MPFYKFFSVAIVPGWRSVALADINMTDTQEMPLFEEDNKDFVTSLVQKPFASSKSLGKRKAREILGGVNMDSGPSNARPLKVLKTRSGQPSTKQAKAVVDILVAHATDKDLVNEGLEGDVAVWVRWSTRAVVRLVPHGERLEFWETKGPRDNGVPVAPEVAEGDGESESAKSVWPPTDKPATKFERVTQHVGELREMEAAIADYAATCKREYTALRFELLQMQTILGKTRQLQGTLVEARREAEEALWEILAFE
ncbi:hypothetical protein C0991_009545 [Blastosporella zonata]|nr:hypothetical protein C0991_009545 [Blastosporella zonata]